MRKKINEIIIKPIKVLLFMSMMCMVSLVFLQVIFRHLNIQVVWTEEVARIFFVWMMTFGIVLVEADNTQSSTELFINKLSPKLFIVWKGIITVLEVLFMVTLFVGSIVSLPQVKMINLGTIRALDYRLLYYPMLLCAPLTMWYLINQWLDLVAVGGKHGDDAKEEIEE